MKNEPDPLTLSAARGARLIALDRLDVAGSTADRLASKSGDLDALHDFRVALRRVRSWLRAFRPDLEDSVTGKDRHRLRDLVDATNRGRDADVQIEWLRAASEHGDGLQKRGAKRLIDLIKTERRLAGPPFNGTALQAFARERTRLAKRLSTISEPVRPPSTPPPSLAAAIGARLSGHLETLRQSLDAVRTADDEREAHAARIAAKRLRYLLEPAENVRGCKTLLTQLKTLQDELGALHDAHLLGHRVQGAVANYIGPDEAALQAIARKLAAERASIFERIERRWLGDETGWEKFSHSVALFAQRLERVSDEPQRR